VVQLLITFAEHKPPRHRLNALAIASADQPRHEERAIVDALNALRHRCTYVFTTGGIGATHADITPECVAKAFGVPIDTDPRALAILHEWVETIGAEMNAARLRMTRSPRGARISSSTRYQERLASGSAM
jgi:molybdopterin-biosynthesis enzyme MoeA-like protein